ncbi:AfsR/SARP family transcriptional regulator [Actinocrispum wychmicini]|uniref:AfsR/SARP family transcriptional regulator n=1 Tax=Actinocrispum wychmicini TaxID=1213861 RepID=UPI0014053C67|nr:AfsR/SARP family transcriptional regulator [Actinocrispum wychmicini]
MEFRLLGPIQVLDGPREVPVPAGRVQTVLAVLLLRANQVTTARELAEYLGEGSARALRPSAVPIYVSRLRHALGPDGARLVRTTSTGYVIDLDPDQLDLTRFRRLVRAATATDQPAERVVSLTEAMTLWRGRPLVDCGPESLVNAELPVLIEERLHVLELVNEARLRLGRHTEAIADLTRLSHEHPLRERFWEQLILALHGSGRRAEALAAYRTVSRKLADELGIDPGARLRNLHQSILTANTATRIWRPQCQLPPAIGDFIGRTDELDRTRALLTSSDTVPIVAICGAPGLGKTATAIRVAHALRPSFPDGQWYTRLTDRDPTDILADLLTTAGTEPAAIPTGLDQRAAALRAALADKRVLLLFDDAYSADQIRPLLPGTAGNAVLVTSTADLTSLTASHSGHTVHLNPLHPAEARALVIGMLNAQQAEAEPRVVAELLCHCGRNPRNLRKAAANLATGTALRAVG